MTANSVRNRVLRYGAALAFLALGAALSTAVPLIRDGPGTPAIVCFFVVLLSAWYGGLGPGLMVTALIALIASNVEWTTWRAVRLALFVAGGATISVLAEVLHRARRRSEEDRRNFEAILASIGDAVIVTDERGRVTFLNRIGEVLCGRSHDDAAGRPLAEVFRIISEETRNPVEDPVAKVLREGTVVGLANHTLLLGADGTERPISDSAAPVRDGRGRIVGVVLVFRDDTDRREHERKLLGENRRKDEFLAMLAHELRNPLASIRSAVELLDTPEADSHLPWARGVIDRQANHLARMIDDLLDVSRITRGLIQARTRPIDGRPVILQAIEAARPLIEDRGHRLEVALGPAPIRLEADPARLEQILINLLNNAAKFTPTGGKIALSAGVSGDRAVLRVADTGIGIAPDMLPHVFDLFAQGERGLDRSEGGLGVGLTIVRRLVELHGGTVAAHSDGPGRGSEFVVRLPVSEGQPEAVAGPPAANDQPDGGTRILVVDDNRELASGLSRLLKRLGHEVRTAFDGPEGLEAALTHRPDVILLDIGLPGMDGYEVARALRREAALGNPFIVAISGYGQEEDRRRSREAGMDHHLTKPVDLKTITDLIRQST